MIDLVRDAMQVFLASTIVQGCEVADENLARWLKGRVPPYGARELGDRNHSRYNGG